MSQIISMRRKDFAKARTRLFVDAEIAHLFSPKGKSEIVCDACKTFIPEVISTVHIALGGPWVICEMCFEKHFFSATDKA